MGYNVYANMFYLPVVLAGNVYDGRQNKKFLRGFMGLVEKCRQLFPKAGIIISDNVLSLVFINKDGECTTQEICNGKQNKDVFYRIMGNAKKLDIAICPGKSMTRMDFYADYHKDKSNVSYFFPMEKDISADELQEILEKGSGGIQNGEYDAGIPFELNRFFMGVDFENPAEVYHALKQWQEFKNPQENEQVLEFDYLTKWICFRNLLREFQKKFPCVDMEIEDPNEFCQVGSGNFYFSSDSNTTEFDGSMLDSFREIVKNSGLIVIESDEDSMSITVFPTEEMP